MAMLPLRPRPIPVLERNLRCEKRILLAAVFLQAGSASRVQAPSMAEMAIGNAYRAHPRVAPEGTEPSEDDEGLLEELFATIDADNSGSLTIKEVLRAMRSMEPDLRGRISDSKWLAPLLKPKEYREHFAAMDYDGDGVVTLKEMKQFWQVAPALRLGSICACPGRTAA